MPRKKVVKPTLKKLNANEAYEVGDFCYFISRYNKVLLGEVTSVNNKDSELSYTVVVQTDMKFMVVAHRHCSDNQSFLRKVKYKDL